MKKILLILALVCLCVPVVAQEKPVIAWGCKIREVKDGVVTLDCRDKAGNESFVLDVPREKWFPEWAAIGDREFYYGIKDKAGIRFAIKTAPTFCDAEYGPRFGSNQVSFQLCGKMFSDDK